MNTLSRKILLAAVALTLLPAFAMAQGFETDISYGMKGDQVLELQEFLGDRGYFAGPYTGNFFSLTLAGVKRFQAAEGIPATGYFGPLSRAAANKIIAEQTPQDEVTETPASPSPIWPMVFTLPNGTVISIDQNGVMTTISQPQPSQPVQGSTSTTTSPSQPAQTQQPQQPQQSQEQPQQPAPFVRSGSASASVESSAATIDRTSPNTAIVSVSFTNNTNEALLFSASGNENQFISVWDNTIAGWDARFFGTYRNDALFNDRRGLKPGETASVRFYIQNMPATTGSFRMSINRFPLAGLTSGEFVEVSGFPVSIGPVEVK